MISKTASVLSAVCKAFEAHILQNIEKINIDLINDFRHWHCLVYRLPTTKNIQKALSLTTLLAQSNSWIKTNILRRKATKKWFEFKTPFSQFLEALKISADTLKPESIFDKFNVRLGFDDLLYMKTNSEIPDFWAMDGSPKQFMLRCRYTFG